MPCLFCKIISHEIPANIVYEDDKIMAFLDIMPVNPGHTLIVPKEHFENILDAPEEILAEMMAVAKKIGKAVEQSLGYEGFNLGVNNGHAAGQAVEHLHFHIMPRKIGDGLKLWPQKKYGAGEAEIIAKKIKENL